MQEAPNPDWDKKIVRTADLNIEVKSFREYTERLHQKVRAAGGYIAQEEQNESTYKIENAVTVKIPVDRFDETVMQRRDQRYTAGYGRRGRKDRVPG